MDVSISQRQDLNGAALPRGARVGRHVSVFHALPLIGTFRNAANFGRVQTFVSNYRTRRRYSSCRCCCCCRCLVVLPPQRNKQPEESHDATGMGRRKRVGSGEPLCDVATLGGDTCDVADGVSFIMREYEVGSPPFDANVGVPNRLWRR